MKGLGGKVVEVMVQERNRGGPFKSIFEFCERVDAQVVTKTVLECLTCCGAFDCFGRPRSQVFAVIESALQRGSSAQEDASLGQLTIFDLLGESGGGIKGENGAAGVGDSYPDIPEWPDLERWSREKEALGFYMSGHPLSRWQALIDRFATHKVADIHRAQPGERMVLGVQFSKLTKKVSKASGKPFWIALVEDLTGYAEIFVNQDLYEAHQEVIQVQNLVFLIGSAYQRDTNISLGVQTIVPIEQGPKQLTEDLSFLIQLDDSNGRLKEIEDEIFRLKTLLDSHHGSTPVFVIIRNRKGEKVVIQVGRDSYVNPDLRFFEEGERLFGRDRFLVNHIRLRGTA